MIISNFHPQIQEIILSVSNILNQDRNVYLVGGALRDALVGRQTHDLDFVLQDHAIQSARRVAEILKADFYPLDQERDTGRVLIQKPPFGRLVIDFAALRGLDIETDLRERDFTINALALDINKPDQLIDPLGGARDMVSRRLSECSPHSFINDPIRILRAIRFSLQFNLRIFPGTISLIRKAVHGIEEVSKERVRDEFFRILDGTSPWNAIRLLDILDALPFLLPELISLKGIQQPRPHIYDAWNHSLMTLERMNSLIEVLSLNHEPEEGTNWTMGVVSMMLGRFRLNLHEHLSRHINPDRSILSLLFFAALYHDTGKRFDPKSEKNSELHFYGHEKTSELIIRERAGILRLSKTEIDRIAKIVRAHMRPSWLSTSKEPISRRAVYRFYRDTKLAGIDVCLLFLADTLAIYGPSLPHDIWLSRIGVARSLLESWWEVNAEGISPEALLNGEEIMGQFQLKPGPKIGELLESLREAQAIGEVKIREEALEFIRLKLTQG